MVFNEQVNRKFVHEFKMAMGKQLQKFIMEIQVTCTVMMNPERIIYSKHRNLRPHVLRQYWQKNFVTPSRFELLMGWGV